jgi:hypothetical protein
MPERIFLTYTNATAVPYQGSTIGHHIVLNYVDSNGKHHTLQGMPEHPHRRNVRKVGAFIADGVRPDGLGIVGPPFGRLQSQPGKGKTFDAPRTMIAEGDDLRSQWVRMKEFGEEVNATGYEYHPTSQNSNSFVAEALRRGGFFGPGTAFPEILDDRLLEVDPASGETRPLRVPAFSARLKNPINVFEHRYGRWAGAADAETPAPGQAASDPNGSFNDPGTNQPIRYLSRRIGASPGQTYNTGTSDGALPTRQAFAPGRPTTFDDRFANWTDSDGAMAPLAPHRAPPEEDNRPRGIFSGKPMSNYPVPPPIFGFPEPGAPDKEDWLLQLLAPRRGR